MTELELENTNYDFFYESMEDHKWFFLEEKGNPEFYKVVADWFIRTGDESRLAAIILLMGTVARLQEELGQNYVNRSPRK